MAGVEEIVIDSGCEVVQADGQVDLAGYKSITQYKFYALNTDREFYVSCETFKTSKPSDPCWCRFIEIDDFSKLEGQHQLYYWNDGELRTGKFRGWTAEQKLILFDGIKVVEVEDYKVIGFKHLMVPYKDAKLPTSFCQRCRAIQTVH